MTISILAWAYQKSSKKDIMLQKSPCGHTAFEILISEKKYNDYLKKDKFFSVKANKINWYNKNSAYLKKKLDTFDINMTLKEKLIENFSCAIHSERDYDKNFFYDKKFYQRCMELRNTHAELHSFQSVLPKYVIHGNENYVSLYFSFWPEKTRNFEGKDYQNSNLIHSFDEKSQSSGFFRSKFQNLAFDYRGEGNGVDIQNLYSDLKPDNLQLIETIPRFSGKNASPWHKKEKKVYMVKSGKLKGLYVTSATYSIFKNLAHYLIKKKSIEHRFVVLQDENGTQDVLNSEANQEIFDELPFKHNSNFLGDLNAIKEKISILNEELALLKHGGFSHHSKHREYIKNIKAIILKLTEEYNYKLNIRNSNFFTKGLPPSHIISLPTIGLEGFGLDEFKVMEHWLNKVKNTHYTYTTTNCAWATIESLSVESKKFAKPPLHNLISPLTPRDAINYFTKVQNEIFGKFSTKLKLHNMCMDVPKKTLWKLDEFRAYYKKSFLGLVSHNTKNEHFKRIEDLIDSYHRIANQYINWRIKCLDEIADTISLWLEDKVDKIATKKYKKFCAIQQILNQISIEREKLFPYLFC